MKPMNVESERSVITAATVPINADFNVLLVFVLSSLSFVHLQSRSACIARSKTTHQISTISIVAMFRS
jgi:hypothetical protein